MQERAEKTSRNEESGTARRILDAAEGLFAAQGFAGVSVREIAGAVDLNQASIYNHFPSKRALYEAVLDRGLTPLRDILAHAAQSLDSAEGGDRLLEELSEHLWNSPNLPKLIQREILDDGEYLERLSSQWLRPIYDQGHAAMVKSRWSATWSEDSDPLIVLMMYHLIFGYFFSAPLTRRVLGVEPMSREMHDRNIAFLKQAAHRLMVIGED
jgi:AcrR family transcriptional regulator